MDPIYEAAMRRRSVRSYTNKQVPKAILEHIIEVGRLAPSGSNVQLTRLLVVQNPKMLDDLRRLVQDAFARMTFDEKTMFRSLESSIARAKEGTYNFFYEAPTLIIACNKIDHPNALSDTACVLDHMMLAATTQEGIGTCWINQLRWLSGEPTLTAFLEALGMEEDEAVFGGLAVGYAQKSPSGVLPRTGNPVIYIK